MQPTVTSYSYNAGAAVFPILADGYCTVHHIHFIPKPLSSLTSYYWLSLHQPAHPYSASTGNLKVGKDELPVENVLNFTDLLCESLKYSGVKLVNSSKIAGFTNVYLTRDPQVVTQVSNRAEVNVALRT